MFPINNYLYDYYLYSSNFGHQIPFNSMSLNQPFYMFYDCNTINRNFSIHSNSEAPLPLERSETKRAVHVLMKE